MKKLLIMLLIVATISICLQVVIINKVSSRSELKLTDVDSVINKVRIDSIELVITEKDCTIVNIKNNVRDEINKANALGDSASVELFKELVTE